VPIAVDTRDVYDGLARLYLPIAIAVFCAVVVVTVWVVVRGAAGGPDEHRGLELSYAAALGLVATALLVGTFRAVDRETASAQAPAEVIRVIAAKWEWRFEYPRHGIVETSAANGAPAMLTVPAGEEVEFRATSVDVVHGFWIPAMKFQRQLIPGQTATFALTFPRPGFTTSGVCSFFCGLEHASMHFTVNVLSPADYDAWVRKSS
jgi:cytochrome c oxidase subunit 2